MKKHFRNIVIRAWEIRKNLTKSEKKIMGDFIWKFCFNRAKDEILNKGNETMKTFFNNRGGFATADTAFPQDWYIFIEEIDYDGEKWVKGQRVKTDEYKGVKRNEIWEAPIEAITFHGITSEAKERIAEAEKPILVDWNKVDLNSPWMN